ncbi:MAG: hypothetical protein IJ481_02385, partial [Alphaproteobacteria bacterium]|nr:hypothetical protein [Alphaproteobacteria bacterium]
STPSVPTETGYNYWLDGKTYVFNNKHWIANKPVTIDKDYTLKLITTGYTGDELALYCNNTFTNNGNVIIDNYGGLELNKKYTSTNNGIIDIINGGLGLYWSAILNNTGTIKFKGPSRIDIYSNTTLTNTGTIDISNITDLSKWY